MKPLALGFLAITAVTLVETDPSRAVPVNGSLIAAGLADISNVEQVRAFCYNTRTGAFSHWGRCRVVCNYTAPAATAARWPGNRQCLSLLLGSD